MTGEAPSPKKRKLGFSGTSLEDGHVSSSSPRHDTPTHFKEHFTDWEVDNLRIEKIQALMYPQLLLEEIPASRIAKRTVLAARTAISDIVQGIDFRIFAVVGPCSIHDPKAAFEYAKKLKGLADSLSEDLVIVMRVYFEKPRTVAGWKGLINDPHLDESFEINAGLRLARKLLADINDIGMAVGCEYLDTMIPQYTADLTAWAAIGARTTECQLHRELASGLSMPVGFKNGTSGEVQIAIDACRSSGQKHCFLGITKQGMPAICHSLGNPSCHVILRGGSNGPNFDSKHVVPLAAMLRKVDCHSRVVVDCSHGNSLKDHARQSLVLEDVYKQIVSGEDDISGVMIESHLFPAAQTLPDAAKIAELKKKVEVDASPRGFSATDPSTLITQRQTVLSQLRYGVSVTDKCVGWPETVAMLQKLAEAARVRRLRHVIETQPPTRAESLEETASLRLASSNPSPQN